MTRLRAARATAAAATTGTPEAQAWLSAVLHAAPRRYRMPALPRDAQAAGWGAPEAALAFAIEAARIASACGRAPSDTERGIFLRSLATLLTRAMQPPGDPALQALVLRATSPEAAEY